jgi:CO dehydrogenase maturation factor
MTATIAFAGKGSTGKSTLCALLVQYLVETRPAERLLVVDADPHQVLTGFLPVAPATTLGALRSQYEREFKSGVGVPPDETREEFAERQMGQQARTYGPGYDLLVMGYWELQGSMCVPNRVLGRALDALLARYDRVVIDYEAGIEPIGRQEQRINDLVLVATPDPIALDVAGRIAERAQAVQRPTEQRWLLLNRATPSARDHPTVQASLARLNQAGIAPLGTLSETPALRLLSMAGRSPLALDAHTGWLSEAQQAWNTLLPPVADQLPAGRKAKK